jgi:hypothetical protein
VTVRPPRRLPRSMSRSRTIKAAASRKGRGGRRCR